MRNFKTLVSQVEKVLQRYVKARNSDKWLTYKLWCDEYPGRVVMTPFGKAIPFEKMMDLPDEQTITRIRRKFSQNKQYLATDPVVLKRREKEGKIKNLIKTFND